MFSDIFGNMISALMHISFVIVIPIKHFQLNFKSYFRGFPGSLVVESRLPVQWLDSITNTMDMNLSKPQEFFPVAQMVKNLPSMQETWGRSLGWEDPLEEGMATHSSLPAWRIPMDRGAWWATVHGIANIWT